MINLVKLQENIYNSLSTLNCPVYDEVPTDSTCPYIEIGTSYFDDDSNKTNDAIELYQYIDVYSDYRGQKEVKEIMQQVNYLMLKQQDKLQLSNASVFVYLHKNQILKKSESMGNYTHAILIYKINIKER